MMKKAKTSEEKSPSTTRKSRNTDKLSLQPVDFNEAIAALLATPPPPKPTKTTPKKHAAKKTSKR
jgi:hypothetical protein